MTRRPCRLGLMLWTGIAVGTSLAAALSRPAMAQTIPVQSGEHADFTRLVLDIGADRRWRLERVGQTVRLVLDPPVDGFDISRVFDFIPRTRLAGLGVRDGLDLTLACPCVIEDSRYRGRYLVLDIRPGADSASRAPAAPLPDMAQLMRGEAPVLPTLGSPFASGPGPRSEADAGDLDVDLQDAARIMAEQLARAAAAGLLQASPGRPMIDADPLGMFAPSQAVAGPDPTVPIPEGEAAPVFPPGVPLRAETALDPDMPVTFLRAPLRDDLACSGAVLAMEDWSGGGPVQDGLGALRLALYDDRDQMRRDGALALARHYIASGFGAEAAFWLGEIDAPPRALLALAALIDEIPGQHFPPEPDLLACSDDELLWRYLAGALDPTILTTEEIGRIQRTAAALPRNLRDQIAVRIARALNADGFGDAARNLRDMLWRGGGLGDAALLRLDRDLGLAMSDPAAARSVLATALRDPRGEPVAAMAHAMRFDRETAVPVSTEYLDAAEALLREQGIGPATAELWHEVVLAQAALGDLERMLQLLAADGLPDGARDGALTALFAERAALGDTPALSLLAHVFGDRWQATGSDAGRARVAAMAHLREVGLTDAAEMLRGGQRMLILPDGPAADPDRADALRAAWESGDWARLGDLADGPHRAVAERMAAPMPPDADRPDPDLPRLVKRLTDSSALRDEIEALLTAPRPVPAEVLQ